MKVLSHSPILTSSSTSSIHNLQNIDTKILFRSGYKLIHKIILKSYGDYVPQVFTTGVWLLNKWLRMIFTIKDIYLSTKNTYQHSESNNISSDTLLQLKENSNIKLAIEIPVQEILDDMVSQCIYNCRNNNDVTSCIAGVRLINELCNFFMHHEYTKEKYNISLQEDSLSANFSSKKI